MRTWEFDFDSCAAGFETRILADYTVNSLSKSCNRNYAIHFCKTVAFSPSGNFGTLGDPYRGFPSAYSFGVELSIEISVGTLIKRSRQNDNHRIRIQPA
ncbi:hypothetical protein V6N13_085495 [Hibiscus sabdariffa]|uniref:Uncharacterized protein n=1 Tax=Hibiscus sabdariffa TaxID=183260 RepID=A0ABR2D1T9_9ROSI